jgi:hypothetical protein
VTKSTLNSLYSIPGMNCHLFTGRKRKSYSFVIYSSQNLNFAALKSSDTQDFFSQWFKIAHPALRLTQNVGFIYRHPQAKVQFFEDFREELETTVTDNTLTYIIGDTNIDTLSQNTNKLYLAKNDLQTFWQILDLSTTSRRLQEMTPIPVLTTS